MRCCHRAIPAVVLLTLAVGCARYQIGNQTLFPSHIQTVYVPTFGSGSFRRELAEWITEAVVKEIEKRSPYKVVSTEAQADSVLTGYLVADTKRTTIVSPIGGPRQQEFSLQVRVSWTDRRGNVLRDGPPIPLDKVTVDVMGTANVVPEVGQSIVTAEQKAIERVAKQVVNLMESPW